MPTPSQRPTSDRKGGASSASNETPVSSAERPDPPPGANMRATRSPELSRNAKIFDASPPSNSADKANGRDHPTESEHDHKHQKLKGASTGRTAST